MNQYFRVETFGTNFVSRIVQHKVATDTFEMYLRLRYRYMKGCIFVSFTYLDTDTITKSWLKMYLRTRYRSKLGWFFWFGPIHVTIGRSLDCRTHFYIVVHTVITL